MDTPSTPVSIPSPTVPPSGAFPEHNPIDGASLIRSTPVKHSSHIVLWLLVLIALVGAGFSGYMVMQNQTALATSQKSMSDWSVRLTALEQKLTTVSTKVDTLSVVPTPVATLPVDFSKLVPTSFSIDGFTAPSTLPTAVSSVLPTSIPLSDDAISPDITGDDTSSSSSVSNGQLTAEDEHGMLESYMQSIRIGEHKTTQPENISLVKNRQSTEDKLFNYDVFKNKETDQLFIYARKSSTNATADFVDGWYGPFAAFPGA